MRNIVWIFVILIIAVGGLMFLSDKGLRVPPPDNNDATEQYVNHTYGISFEYPNTYQLREIEVGNAERAHYSITLADTEALRNLPEAGEGPPTITVDIFQNDIDKLSVDTWLKNSNNSNFKLSPDDVIEPTTLGGASALSYTWDGLYRGKSIVATHRDAIIMVSGQFLSAEDQIVKDYEQIVSSLAFF